MTSIQASTAPSTDAAMAVAAGAVKSSAADTQHRFLSLLVAQMRNQDPLNPMDNAQLTTQLAQISTVNGVEELNVTMKSMAGDFGGLQTLQAASLPGRQVMVNGNTLAFEGRSVAGGFQLDQAVEQVSVSIVDAAGAQLQRVTLGPLTTGIHGFEWDGATDAGGLASPGTYYFKLQAVGQGNAVPAQPLAMGRVDGVGRTADGVSLNLGRLGNVGLADVKRIL